MSLRVAVTFCDCFMRLSGREILNSPLSCDFSFALLLCVKTSKLTLFVVTSPTHPGCCDISNVALFSLSISTHPPSIFYTRLILRSGRAGAGAYPSSHRSRGGVHPGQVASPSQRHTETNDTNNHTRSHSLQRQNFFKRDRLTFLDGGRKPEYPESFGETHAYTHTRGEHAKSNQYLPVN